MRTPINLKYVDLDCWNHLTKYYLVCLPIFMMKYNKCWWNWLHYFAGSSQFLQNIETIFLFSFSGMPFSSILILFNDIWNSKVYFANIKTIFRSFGKKKCSRELKIFESFFYLMWTFDFRNKRCSQKLLRCFKSVVSNSATYAGLNLAKKSSRPH